MYIEIIKTKDQDTEFKELAEYVKNKTYLTKPNKALELTSNIIAHNTSNYTAWWIRRRCLEVMQTEKSALISELKGFTRTALEESVKSYQIWYHRMWLLKRLGTEVSKDLLADELADVCEHLEADSKNHCAWEFRQELVSYFKLPIEPEYEYAENMILSDPRNNSAWNYRQWLCQQSSPEFADDIRKRETKFVGTWLQRTPTNEACFHYLLGLFQDPITKTPSHLPSLKLIHPSVRDIIMSLTTPEAAPKTHMLELKAALLIAEGNQQEARQLYDTLTSEDFTHAGYYQWLKSNA
eukprot:Blabericola_migrator_1__12925@NODE_84_length_14850_cov_98_458703_g75_i0_p7_GENE_NODE_84_length_14850_cov_98_458703_g75_i0NODE_84_length_14850_cov_98_458703_g75_i0_p7_ORF_typecomplete_len295_score67_00PPTA/PF01239_22/0_00019PPTA/PF01239_22/1_1e06PPTA/PF01239_22/1_3PPTA/PF01239_22/1_4e09NARP1/PF12569_8/66NARP1/PF12569_8/0_13TPR_21/PF09976_9/2_9e02TPR_21/PF09976_9/0_55_NODE_84_length_14850_cov_98_458703_g75_i025909